VYKRQHQNWQFRTYHGVYENNVGTAKAAPWGVTWNTEWVPDQSKAMKFMARVTDEKGFISLTPVVDGITLARAGKSVRLYKSFDMPSPGTATTEKAFEHKLDEIKEDLTKATDAVGYITSYHGISANGVYVNTTKVLDKLSNANYIYSVSEPKIPLAVLKTGVNTVKIQSVDNSSQHGTDVMWPGLEIKVRYTGIEPVKPVALIKAKLRNSVPSLHFRKGGLPNGITIQGRQLHSVKAVK
jgi:hypothetical protein